jgi:hypothetical protein
MSDIKQQLTEKLEQVVGKEFVKNKVIIDFPTGLDDSKTKPIDAYAMLEKIRNTQFKGFHKIKSYFDRYDTDRLLLAGRTIHFASPTVEKEFSFDGCIESDDLYADEEIALEAIEEAIEKGETDCYFAVSVRLHEDDEDYDLDSQDFECGNVQEYYLDMTTGKVS